MHDLLFYAFLSHSFPLIFFSLSSLFYIFKLFLYSFIIYNKLCTQPYMYIYSIKKMKLIYSLVNPLNNISLQDIFVCERFLSLFFNYNNLYIEQSFLPYTRSLTHTHNSSSFFIEEDTEDK